LIIPGGLASLVIKIRDWYVGVVLRRQRPSTDVETPPDIDAMPSTDTDGTIESDDVRVPAGERSTT